MNEIIEVNTEVVFSSSHITPQCGEALISAASGDYQADRENNLMSICIEFHEPTGVIRIFVGDNDEHLTTGYEELDNLLQYAREHNHKWLVIDPDVKSYDSFPIHNWEKHWQKFLEKR